MSGLGGGLWGGGEELGGLEEDCWGGGGWGGGVDRWVRYEVLSEHVADCFLLGVQAKNMYSMHTS